MSIKIFTRNKSKDGTNKQASVNYVISGSGGCTSAGGGGLTTVTLTGDVVDERATMNGTQLILDTRIDDGRVTWDALSTEVQQRISNEIFLVDYNNPNADDVAAALNNNDIPVLLKREHSDWYLYPFEYQYSDTDFDYYVFTGRDGDQYILTSEDNSLSFNNGIVVTDALTYDIDAQHKWYIMTGDATLSNLTLNVGTADIPTGFMFYVSCNNDNVHVDCGNSTRKIYNSAATSGATFFNVERGYTRGFLFDGTNFWLL